MLAKRFFYVCAGILCLAFAYHLGSTNATAQTGKSGDIRHLAVYGDNAWVVTSSDDIYWISQSNAPNVSFGKGWKKFQLGILR